MDTGPIDYAPLLRGLREAFSRGTTRSIRWRKAQLRALRTLLIDHEDEVLEALRADMGKPAVEAWITDVRTITSEIDHVLARLHKWTKPERVRTPLVQQPGSARIVREPYGVVLVIGTWNYPFQLTLLPLVAAISAGNCAVIKPSEIAPRSAAVMVDLLPRYLDPSCFRVVEGGVPETTALLEQRFDYIFFTGGGRVGRVVMAAAAKHLTPVTLELGGKSPAIVDRDADLSAAARRIAWGKFFNAGQTCIAPDYVLVHGDVEEAFLEEIRGYVHSFYGDDPRASADYARLVNDRHFERVCAFLEDGEVVVGGEHDASQRFVAPTVLRDVDPGAPVMQEEIFGPVLPVLAVRDMDEAVARVNAGDKPLALYVFSRNREVVDGVIGRTSSGGVCVNDTVVHFTVPQLPFGGVGESGMGAYHGVHGFETFSHRRGVLDKGTRVDPSFRYPPYGESTLRWVRRLL